MYDPTATIFWTGFFACMFSIAPLMILLYLPSTKYLVKDTPSRREKELLTRINQLESEVRIYESLAGAGLWDRVTRDRQEKASI